MILATTAEVYERFSRHPGWGRGVAGRERYDLWLEMVVGRAPAAGFGPVAAWAERWHWIEARNLHRTRCIADAAALLGDPGPDEDWAYLDDETGEIVCRWDCPLCRSVAVYEG